MKKIFDYIDNLKDSVVELQKGLTGRPAVNPENGGDGEYEKYIFLKNYLSDFGFDNFDEILVPDERVKSGIRPSLTATINGNDSSRNLWIITHMDVVPAGDLNLWNTDPFEAVVKDDKIFGRGTEDNQQSLVSSLIAAKAVIDNKVKPEYNIKLLFVSDEEVGSFFGIHWILENRNIFNKNDLILTPDVGDPEGRYIEIAEKSILWVYFTITGKQSHASRPDLGINANRACSHLSVRLEELNQIFSNKNDIFDLPLSTFEPTMRKNTTMNMNTIPGIETLGLDCRILPEYDLDKVLSVIDRIKKSVEDDYKVKIDIELKQRIQSPPPTSEKSEIVTLLKKSIKNVLDVDAETIGIGGGTVAAYFRMKGYDAALWSTVDNVMHSPNEYSSIKNTINDAKVFAYLMLVHH